MARYAGSLKPDFDFGDFRNAEGNLDSRDWLAAEDEWLEKLKAELKAKNPGDLVGETVSWPRADGRAIYVITKQRPLTLKHVAIGDAWEADGATIRGFRLKDAKAQVGADRKWKAHVDERARAHKAFYDGMNVRAVVHYHNSFGQFVRCEVVVADVDGSNFKKGDKVLKPVALVGAWRGFDLNPESYHRRNLTEGTLTRPGAQNVYECSLADNARRRMAGSGSARRFFRMSVALSPPAIPRASTAQ